MRIWSWRGRKCCRIRSGWFGGTTEQAPPRDSMRRSSREVFVRPRSVSDSARGLLGLLDKRDLSDFGINLDGLSDRLSHAHYADPPRSSLASGR